MNAEYWRTQVDDSISVYGLMLGVTSTSIAVDQTEPQKYLISEYIDKTNKDEADSGAPS